MTLFLAAAGQGHPGVTIIGAPLDITESFRTGAASAPARIRELSQSLETYSPALGKDLTEISLIDRGDLALSGLTMPAALQAIGDAVAAAAPEGLVLTLGGEHTVTLGAVSALHSLLPDLVVVQIDAHLDLLDEYQGVVTGHATVARRILDVVGPQSLVQLAARSGTSEEFSLARYNALVTPHLKLSARVKDILAEHPVYLSIDIDALDPAFAPGTGYPEPGGPSFAELADFLYSLDGIGVVAGDICEVLPAADPSNITSVAAAKLVREMALLFA